MNRIKELFSTQKQDILSVFYTAGFPNLEDTVSIAKALQDAGADMLEIGIPFSDPLADGPVIQHSSKKALENGMSLKVLFRQLEELRKEVSIPVLLMGYFNPVLQYGVEKFCADCERVGVDGLIIPDLPMAEYERFYQGLFEKHSLSNVFLVTPESSAERIRRIDTISKGFIYLLSSSATTGQSFEQAAEHTAYFERIRAMQLNNPILIGFGIATQSAFAQACKYANGAIVGSAFVKQLEQKGLEGISAFVRSLRG